MRRIMKKVAIPEKAQHTYILCDAALVFQANFRDGCDYSRGLMCMQDGLFLACSWAICFRVGTRDKVERLRAMVILPGAMQVRGTVCRG